MADTPSVETIRQLRSQGMTQQAIAKEVGRSRSYVQKVLASPASVRAERPTLKGHVRVVTPKWAKAEGSVVGEARGQSLPMPDNIGEWNSLGLEADTWKALGKNLTLPTLSSISPGISRAVWDYLRMLDPGHEIMVYYPGTEEPYDDGQAVLQRWIDERVLTRFSSTKALFQQMFMGALFRGAFCTQIITDDAGREPLELLVPDPVIIRFRPTEDEARGMFWEPGIIVDGIWESVESPLFRYVAVDPLPGHPYGRSMIAPSAFPSIFIIGLLYDLRRVVAQQGYPRTNVTVIGELLRDNYPTVSEEDFRGLLEQLVDQVSDHYSTLQPDDAFVHSDAVTVSNAAGAVETGIVGGAASLIDVLERMEVKALKMMPLMMGMTDGVSEANANRQWEIWVAGVKAMQHFAETVVQHDFEMVLRLYGIQATVSVKFAEIRTSETQRDETARKLVMENAVFARDQGWINDEEASMEAVGHEPTGVKAPEPPVMDRSEQGVRAKSDDTPYDTLMPTYEVDDRAMRRALDVWQEAFEDDPERALLQAEVE